MPVYENWNNTGDHKGSIRWRVGHFHYKKRERKLGAVTLVRDPDMPASITKFVLAVDKCNPPRQHWSDRSTPVREAAKIPPDALMVKHNA